MKRGGLLLAAVLALSACTLAQKVPPTLMSSYLADVVVSTPEFPESHGRYWYDYGLQVERSETRIEGVMTLSMLRLYQPGKTTEYVFDDGTLCICTLSDAAMMPPDYLVDNPYVTYAGTDEVDGEVLDVWQQNVTDVSGGLNLLYIPLGENFVRRVEAYEDGDLLYTSTYLSFREGVDPAMLVPPAHCSASCDGSGLQKRASDAALAALAPLLRR